MTNPKITRPIFPKGYVDAPKSEVSWAYVTQRLEESRTYWLSTVRPNQRPHAIPRWGVWLEDRFYYDGSPETRHARNLSTNPETVLHLENGDQPVIIEGFSQAAGKPDPVLAEKISAAYCKKYAADGYAPKATQWDEGGLYIFTPRTVLAWTVFFENPTKFIFE